jgi:hypothetical protein
MSAGKMKIISPLIFAFAVLAGCDHPPSSKSAALPENVKHDRPIVLKEGQAVVIAPEGNKSLLIGASVVNGKLSIAEIDPEGRSFGVAWTNADEWETSTTVKNAMTSTITIDKTMDGVADLQAVMDQNGIHRFTSGEQQWNKLPSDGKEE